MSLVLFNYAPLWSATSASTQATLTQAYTQAWFDRASKFTPQQYYQGNWASYTENPATDDLVTAFGGNIWYMLPRMRFVGVDPTLTDQIAAWSATIWPAGDWNLNESATCSSIQVCTSGY